MLEQTFQSEQTLKRALLANALFSIISGLTLIVFSQPVAELVGLGAPRLYQITGAGLLAFAGYVVWTATRSPINTYEALQISLGDFLWVLGTVVIIAFAYSSLNPAGILVMLLVAAIVLAFGIGQLKGIGNVYAVPGKTAAYRICIAVDTPEPADKIWSIIADMASIKEYSPHLTHVSLRNDATPGVGAVRQCTDDKGKTWAEQCTRYDHDARALKVTFLANEPSFPYPFKTMDGGWDVRSSGSGSTVHVWFEVTPKYPWFHAAILAFMAKNIARNFGHIVARMAAAARGEAVSQQASPPLQDITFQVVPCYF